MKIEIRIAVACVSVFYWRGEKGDARATREEHKLRSEDAFCQLRLGRENLLEFVWRDGVIAPYRFVWRDGVIAPYRDAFKL